MNRLKPHVIVVPEDDADRQLADGFVAHHAVDARTIRVVPPAGGWMAVLQELGTKYAAYLGRNLNAHVVLLIDFDEEDDRRERFEQAIPDSLKTRVFVIGSWDEPEAVRRETGMTFEKIGDQLADECFRESYELWDSPHFAHNAEERARLAAAVKSFLFKR